MNNQDLETRIVILEAALAWVRHEASTRARDPRAMARIAAIATQVLDEDEERTMKRRLAHASPASSGTVASAESTEDLRAAAG